MDAPENEQVHELVAAWFRALDRHASIDECASMLAIRNLRMHFPDADVHDTDQFREWYERVCRTYFDEQHTTQKVVIESAANDEVRVTVVVRWQASTRDAPAAMRRRLDKVATQRWNLRKSTRNSFGWEIVDYDVASLVDASSYPDLSQIQRELTDLNIHLGEMEQSGGPDGVAYFGKHLSDQLVFRRANGAVVGKKEFLTGLVKGNPFATRISDQISVNVVGDRALVTLIVVGTRADDNSIHHYRNIRFFSRPAGEWLVDGWYNYEVTGV